MYWRVVQVEELILVKCRRNYLDSLPGKASANLNQSVKCRLLFTNFCWFSKLLKLLMDCSLAV